MTLNADREDPPGTYCERPWPPFIALLVGSFITIEASAFQLPAMPAIAEHFGLGEDVTSLIPLVYYLALVALSPVFGRIADSYGRKRVVLGGLFLFAVTECAAALAPTFTALVVARFGQGVAVACILPILLSYIGFFFSPGERGFPLGLLGAAMGLGAVSGSMIGGLLIDSLGWRSIYWVSGITALFGLALVAVRVPETPTTDAPYKLDVSGAVLLLVSIGMLLSIPTWTSNFGFFSLPTLSVCVLSLLGMMTLWRVEKKAYAPIIKTDIFGQKDFLLPAVIYFLFLVCHGGAMYALAFFIANRPGGSAAQIGTITMLAYTSGIAGSLMCGKLVDKVNERFMVMAIVALMMVGLLSYSSIGLSTPLWLAAGIAMVLGCCQGMKGPAITKIALRSVPAQRMSAGSAMFTMMRDFGSPAGVAISLALFTATRINATQSALIERAAEAGLNESHFASLRAAFAGNPESFPELMLRLNELGMDFDKLTAMAARDGLSSVLASVGGILLAISGVALALTMLLSKGPSSVEPQSKESSAPLASQD